MKQKPCFAIIGGTIWGNRGAESMLTTTIGVLRGYFPEAHFIVFSYYPEQDKNLISDKSITVLSSTPLSLITIHLLGSLTYKLLRFFRIKNPGSEFLKIAGHLAKCDCLLDIGGITFSDGREKYLPFNILTILPALWMGVPVVKMAQALGPFEKSINRFVAKSFLPRCRHIFARGENTGAHLASLGFPQNKYSVVPDIAFLYRPAFSLSNENGNYVNDLLERIEGIKDTDKKIIILSPSMVVRKQSERFGINYLHNQVRILLKLPEDRYHFIVMPNATRENSAKEHNNDILLIKAMRREWENSRRDRENVSWIDFDINSQSVREVIACADLLITSRYHAMIAGICMTVPTLVIAWSHKYHETLKVFNLYQYALDFSHADIDLQEWIEQMIERNKGIRKKMQTKLAEVQHASMRQFVYIKDMINAA